MFLTLLIKPHRTLSIILCSRFGIRPYQSCSHWLQASRGGGGGVFAGVALAGNEVGAPRKELETQEYDTLIHLIRSDATGRRGSSLSRNLREVHTVNFKFETSSSDCGNVWLITI
jgi:hypothetical protein